ncbi:putative quinol monooxygenase [Paracoccaceae bacterium GXU_MW_L88]
MGVTLTGTFDGRADPELVRRLLPEHIALSRAEPGCIAFRVSEDPETPGLFHLFEEFESQADFEAHQARTKASEWGRATSEFPRDYDISA